MGRSKTQELAISIQGQHLALSVAAHLARTQLVPEPLRVYDGQHLSEMLDVVARSIAKVVPLYVQDPQAGSPRELSHDELQGAEVRRGATLLVLKDGRTLSSVTIKRRDLRQAVAILKTVGIPELKLPKERDETPPAPPRERIDPLAVLAEIDALLRPPLVAAQIEKANSLAVSLARSAPQGHVANLAMRLVSAVHEARAAGEAPDAKRLELALARLRAALEEIAAR
jgi:hypothetical protein